MPPSPSLLARMTNVRYLSVTTSISAQKMSESTPSTFSWVGGDPVLAAERLGQREERVGPEVAVDDAERAEREGDRPLAASAAAAAAPRSSACAGARGSAQAGRTSAAGCSASAAGYWDAVGADPGRQPIPRGETTSASLEPPSRIELETYGLRNRCSTPELGWQCCETGAEHTRPRRASQAAALLARRRRGLGDARRREAAHAHDRVLRVHAEVRREHARVDDLEARAPRAPGSRARRRSSAGRRPCARRRRGAS